MAGKVNRVSGAIQTEVYFTTEQRVSDAVEQAIEQIREKLISDQSKPSVADLVRLLQLKKELDGERPKDVIVRWVEDEWNDNPLNAE